ncbi:hypothetical protein CRM22_001903 [Opisthorchis felineus]|uniref:EF-hand domain-containing protein n=1 Tax=Opisthorchis felineus TaxID=147828 RepID=A0A4S2M8I2_OPIFE|nr:hypothetical protein CRM22_001903 [Opisthorchis felineus]
MDSMDSTDPAESYAYELLEKGLMTKEQLADIRWAFHFFDKNGDGSISMDEMATVLSYLGHEASHEDLQNLMKPADENGDGTLDFGEFLRAMSEYYVQRPTKRGTKPEDNEFYRRAFAEFDKDGDGYISAEELQVLMTSFGEALTHDDIMEMIREADKDGDGKVNFEDFLQVLQ